MIYLLVFSVAALLFTGWLIGYLISPSVAFYTSQTLPQKVLGAVRWIYSYPIPVIATTTGLVVGYAIYWTNVEPIVSVTLFYATVLFLGSILQTEHPFPILTIGQPYYDTDYSDEEEEQGYEYEFHVQNIGQKSLISPRIEYKVFDGNKRPQTDWEPVPGTSRQKIEITHGDTGEYSITDSPVTPGEEADCILAIRILPRRGSRFLGLWWVTAIGVGVNQPSEMNQELHQDGANEQYNQSKNSQR